MGRLLEQKIKILLVQGTAAWIEDQIQMEQESITQSVIQPTPALPAQDVGEMLALPLS